MKISPRDILFQIHLWTGLGLGILFILLGLSGTALMFRTVPGIGTQASDIRATATGNPLPIESIIESARASASTIPAGASTIVVLPRAPGEPAHVRFQRAAGRGGPGEAAGRGGAEGPGAAPGAGRAASGPPAPPRDILVDPVSGAVLGEAATGMTGFMQFWHDLHGQLLIGVGAGRPLVGWLGVAMTFLALSGIYLWWPRRGQWKNAFIVRRSAKGLRFHRELHGAVGIWFVIVLFIVSFTGVAIVFPEPIRAGFSVVASGNGAASPAPAGPGRGAPRVPQVEPIEGTAAIGADKAIQIVQAVTPDARIQSVTIPARADQAITVTAGAGRGAPRYVDPYRGTIIETAAPSQPATRSALDVIMGSMRGLHEGEGFGAIYWTLVMLSGFLPLLFVITGFFMWLKKRQNRDAVKSMA